MKVHRLGSFSLWYDFRQPYRYRPIIAVMYGTRFVDLAGFISRAIRARDFLRGLFPSFHAVGLRDCDSGGRVFAWYPVLAWNRWHLERQYQRWNGAGDGEVWSRLSFREWRQMRRERAE